MGFYIKSLSTPGVLWSIASASCSLQMSFHFKQGAGGPEVGGRGGLGGGGGRIEAKSREVMVPAGTESPCLTQSETIKPSLQPDVRHATPHGSLQAQPKLQSPWCVPSPPFCFYDCLPTNHYCDHIICAQMLFWPL